MAGSSTALKRLLLLWSLFLTVLLAHSRLGRAVSVHQTHQTDGRHGRDTEIAARSEPQAEPESTASAEPEAKTATKARPENKANPEPSPEGEISKPAPETSPESETWPEPGPRWDGAFKTWKWAWPLHVYVFATAFLFIGFYSGYFVVFNLYDGLQGKYLSVSLNAMALLFGMSRAFVLYLDPYHQGNLINELLFMRMMWSIGGPCLTSADSLIILALIETARVSLGPPQFQKLSTISGIIAFHFAFVLATDAVVSLYMEAKAMILFCQLFFSLWGIILGSGYILLAYKLDKKLFAHKEVKDKEDKIYIYLVYASGGANFLIVAIMFYTTVGPFGIYADIKFVDSWHWYILQTLFRLSEVITCILVFTVSAKRSRVKRAVEELESTVFQVTEGNSNLSIMGRLQGFVSRLRRTNRVTSDDIIDEKEEEMLRAAWLGRQPSLPVTQKPPENGVASPNQSIPSRSPRPGRRQSLFSAMQDASISSTLSNNVISTGRTRRENINPASSNTLNVPSRGGRRGRRQSLFSAMQEASISSTLNENIITTGRTRRETNPASEQSNSSFSPQTETGQKFAVPGGVVNLGLDPGHERRERRRSLFTGLQENNGKNVLSHTLMEEEGEDEASKEVVKRKRPSLLKRDSSLRNVLRRISGLVQPHPKEPPEKVEDEATVEVGNAVKVEVDSPSISSISIN